MRRMKRILIAIVAIFFIGCAAVPTDSPDAISDKIGNLYGEDTSNNATNITADSNQSPTENEASMSDGNDSGFDNTHEDTDDNNEPDLPPQSSTFSVHFIDVGQADATLIECDGHYMLIDGGNKADSNLIYSVLKKAEVSKLDIVVGTHAHEDHIGGLPGAFNYTAAAVTLCPVKHYDSDAFEDFKKYAEQMGGGITVPSVGDTYLLGSATVAILGVNSGTETNNTSIVLLVQYGQTKFLFTSDAEREAEQAIINSGVDLTATVLKVGHHGSESSTSYLFLRNIAPRYAVISVGEDNSYGHPAEDVLSRLRDADVTVFRTDLQGDIFCTSDGTNVSFAVERNTDADTLQPAVPQDIPDLVPPQDHATEKEPDGGSSSGTNYIGNKDTKKFHYDWCISVKRMKESNKYYYTGTRDEMIEQGYDPCGNCNP